MLTLFIIQLNVEMVNEGFSYVTNPIEPQEISVDGILLANKIGGMPMIGVKKSCFKIGGLSTALRSLEDYDFLLKLCARSNV